MRRVLAIFLGLLSATASAPLARAQTSDDPATTAPSAPSAPAPAPVPGASAPADARVEEARSRLRRAHELFEEGDHRLALIEFERANEILPSFKIFYNIAQVHLELGEYAKAHAALERYLREGGAEVPAERRAAVERDLANVRKRIALLSIEVNVPDAVVMLGDVPVGKAPIHRLVIDAGAQRLVVSKSGHLTETRFLKLAGGDEQTVHVDLSPDTSPSASSSSDGSGLSTPALASWIVTGLLAAGAVGTGIAANAASSKFDAMRDSPFQGSPEQARADLDRQGNLTDTLAIATDVLIVSTLVAGGVSLYFTLRGRPQTAPKAARVFPQVAF